MSDQDRWKKRARELFLTGVHGNQVDHALWRHDVAAEKAIQLGREMADTRAEEIAERIDRSNPYATERGCLDFCAAVARATISPAPSLYAGLTMTPEKAAAMEAPELIVTANVPGKQHYADALKAAMDPLLPEILRAIDQNAPKTMIEVEAAIRADEREKIAAEARKRAMKWDTCRDAAPALMGLVLWLEGKNEGRPKTREQVLEEALREINRLGTLDIGSPQLIARRALEWKP